MCVYTSVHTHTHTTAPTPSVVLLQCTLVYTHTQPLSDSHSDQRQIHCAAAQPITAARQRCQPITDERRMTSKSTTHDVVSWSCRSAVSTTHRQTDRHTHTDTHTHRHRQTRTDKCVTFSCQISERKNLQTPESTESSWPCR